MSTDGNRLPPEHFLTLIRQQQRGRLKVYLGFAAGVGKTFEMLQEGQRLRRQGVDVVIGVVETHGRAETMAQISDLEQIPRRRIGVGDRVVRGDHFFRNDQHVDRGLRVDVVERQAAVVFVGDLRRDLLLDDLQENVVAHHIGGPRSVGRTPPVVV